MTKITDPDLLIINTNLAVNTSAKTITLNAGGSLVAKDGVTLQSLYSKLVDLWTTDTYNKYPFPMVAIDARSGQFQFGTDGNSYNGWKPGDDATRQMLRDGGWSEYSQIGILNRQYAGIVILASGCPAGTQMYYQRTSGGTAYSFTYTDAPNEGIQVYGDAANGNFDNRTYFKVFCREAGYFFDDVTLEDIGEIATGPYRVSLPIFVSTDIKTAAPDTLMTSGVYANIKITYYETDQTKIIGSTGYPFRVVINGNSGTLEQIYTKLKYLLRQAGDIDEGPGSVTGRTAAQLAYFIGNTLYTAQGVFIENILNVDVNRIIFMDQNGAYQQYPYTSGSGLLFSDVLDRVEFVTTVG